jgi:hypothetical protein
LLLLLLLLASAVGSACAVADSEAQEVKLYEGRDASADSAGLGVYTAPGGRRLRLGNAVGSSLFRAPGDPAGRFWALGDRGPSVGCDDAEDILEVDGKDLCDDPDLGRLFLRPGYAPTIFTITLDDAAAAAGTFSVTGAIPLKRADGRPATGLPNPLTRAVVEVPLDGEGRRLAPDPGGIDPEALVRLADGSFWIGEEYAPSLLQVAPDGTILRRLVPEGMEGDLAGAGYPVLGTLPAVLARRQPNRGIEGLALGEGGRFLYAAMQSPLANPDADAYKRAANLRLLKVDAATGRPVAEFVYTLEPMAGFDGEERKAQSAARVSELVHLGGDERFLVVDRTDKTAHLVLISLAGATDILGSAWDDPATSPSLEETALRPAATGAGAGAAVRPATKTLVFDTADQPELPGKIEGVALDGDGTLVMVNDDDFELEGERTTVIRVEGLELGR